MNGKKDWIIENMNSIIKHKGIKMEIISSAIGISQGEFSKILSGQRLNYYEHLPKIAEVLGVNYHELIKQESSIIQTNHHQEGGTAMLNGVDQTYIDKLVSQCDHTIQALKDTIKTLEMLVQNEKEAKDNFKRKYEKMKAKVLEFEKAGQTKS